MTVLNKNYILSKQRAARTHVETMANVFVAVKMNPYAHVNMVLLEKHAKHVIEKKNIKTKYFIFPNLVIFKKKTKRLYAF